MAFAVLVAIHALVMDPQQTAPVHTGIREGRTCVASTLLSREVDFGYVTYISLLDDLVRDAALSEIRKTAAPVQEGIASPQHLFTRTQNAGLRAG
jgi:hypothetical protein